MENKRKTYAEIGRDVVAPHIPVNFDLSSAVIGDQIAKCDNAHSSAMSFAEVRAAQNSKVDAMFDQISQKPASEPELCAIPTDEERAANQRELSKLSRANRFRLMFGLPMLDDHPASGEDR